VTRQRGQKGPQFDPSPCCTAPEEPAFDEARSDALTLERINGVYVDRSPPAHDQENLNVRVHSRWPGIVPIAASADSAHTVGADLSKLETLTIAQHILSGSREALASAGTSVEQLLGSCTHDQCYSQTRSSAPCSTFKQVRPTRAAARALRNGDSRDALGCIRAVVAAQLLDCGPQ
jgi:hypothetical protein